MPNCMAFIVGSRKPNLAQFPGAVSVIMRPTAVKTSAIAGPAHSHFERPNQSDINVHQEKTQMATTQTISCAPQAINVSALPLAQAACWPLRTNTCGAWHRHRSGIGRINRPRRKLASGRQSDIGADTSRSLEPRQIVDRRLEAECRDRTLLCVWFLKRCCVDGVV